MGQFDVYANPSPDTSQDVPYLLNLQSDLLDPLVTRVVAPLVRYSVMPKQARYLNPVFEVRGERAVMSTAERAGVPTHALGSAVGNLSECRDDIIRAIDCVISGI